VRYLVSFSLCLLVVTLPGGCPAENYENRAAATLDQINRIATNSSLSVQERRARLRNLGLSDSTINAFLRTERLGNQFGGDLRTAYTKLVESRFTELTPDEVQIFGDQASLADTTGQLSVRLNDDEAQAVVDFFRDNGLNSKDALKAWLDVTGNEPPDTIPDAADTLRGLFVDFDLSLLLPRLP